MSAYKILVVEDEAISAFSLKETLEEEGYIVSGLAANSQEALQELALCVPQLVLMDIHLEEKEEGIRLGKQIMEQYKVPVVYLTAFADKETIRKAKETFPYGYMIKPYAEMELWAMIETAIHKHLADSRERELNETRQKFFSIVAHDLRSPLAALSVTTRMLNKKFNALSAEDLKSFLVEMQETVDTIYTFTDNLLEWAHIQSGRLRVFPEEVKLQEIIEEAFSLLRGKASEKNIPLLQKNELQELLLADRTMLRSIMLNLVQNSLKFSHSASPVQVNAWKEGSWGLLEVKDEGVGMSEEQLKKLFDFNVRSSTPGTVEEKGSGLGLLLCKEFAEANGGSLEVYSRRGEGTTIRIKLPLAAAQ